MEETTTVASRNEKAIDEFFGECEKRTYIEFLREMFDAYITNWRYLQKNDPIDQANDVSTYRQIEKLIESIN